MTNKTILMVLLACAASQTLDLQAICQTESSCISDPNCQCYCSVVCNFRAKNASDSPLYLENDPAGIKCYCKPWDYENYTNNCSR